ncbi:MAG TPA: DNA cytosine methyltransferase [Solirubrobacteraceae bacterium]|nr:DNA cytosine methyltransferase [Solirubrobacteraceae bacterium]
MPERRVIDLFAGAGGWDEGLRRLGYEAVGIDVDKWACETAQAAGHERLVADVAALDPREFGPVWGLIASPPCQAWSVAGRGLGREDKPQVIACVHELTAGSDTRAERLAACSDPRSLLTVEPLRWTLALRPRWVAFEQVPPVLGLWTLFAALLSTVGYETAVGVLPAEQYGVPQTRTRAFLIASLDGPVQLPAPTHRSYDPHRPDRVRDGEERLEPWVSMAAALGWSCPAVTYTNSQTHYGTRPRGLARSTDSPARTLDRSCRNWTIEPASGAGGCRLDSGQRHTAVRPARRRAPRLTVSGLAKCHAHWVCERPATTVLGDPRVQPPGHKHNRHDPPGRYPQRRGEHAVRITVQQAAVLQGFRPDYPWQGSQTEQFTQIGNAVCPPLARAVLAAAMRPSQTRGRP